MMASLYILDNKVFGLCKSGIYMIMEVVLQMYGWVQRLRKESALTIVCTPTGDNKKLCSTNVVKELLEVKLIYLYLTIM